MIKTLKNISSSTIIWWQMVKTIIRILMYLFHVCSFSRPIFYDNMVEAVASIYRNSLTLIHEHFHSFIWVVIFNYSLTHVTYQYINENAHQQTFHDLSYIILTNTTNKSHGGYVEGELYIDYYFSHPAAFSHALQNLLKYLWFGLHNPDQRYFWFFSGCTRT